MEKEYEWQEIGYLLGSFQLRFESVAISEDGKYCFGIYVDGTNPVIKNIETGERLGSLEDPFDVPTGTTISDDEREWWSWQEWAEANLQGEHIHVNQGPLPGKYRLFGLVADSSKTINEQLQMRVTAEEATHEVIVYSTVTGDEIQRMPYRYMSSGWVAVTFSDDGSTIGVIEPVNATFYHYLPKEN